MDRFPDEIVEHYDREIDEGRRITQGLGQLELLRTREIVRRHLPPAPSRVLDVGGGTGVHAAWLASDGYDVHLIDRVPRHVDQARRLAPLPPHRAGRPGPCPPGGGPGHSSRRRRLRRRHLPVRFAVRRPGPRVPVRPGVPADVERDLREGQHRNPQHRPHWFTTAYFHHPEELRAEVADAGLEVVELVGVEGLAGFLPQLDRRWENAPDRELILWSARVAEAEPSLLGLSAHLLVVARPALYVVEGLGGVTADVSQRGGDVGGPAGRRRHADGEVAQVAIAGSCAGPALEASSHRSRRDCQPPGAWEMEPVRLRSWQPARSAPSTAAMPPGPH